MRLGAQWIYDREGFSGNDDPTWLGIGFFTADAGGILLLVSLVLSIVGLRRLRPGTSGSVLARIVGVLALVALVAYAVTVWAMSAKPD
jgi:hypothetical protein